MKTVFKLSLLSVIALLFVLLACQDEAIDRPEKPDAVPPSGEVASIAYPEPNVTQPIFVIPVITFAYIPDEAYPVKFREERFRLILDEATLSTNVTVPTTKEWSTDKDSLRLIPKGILQANTLHTVTVTTHWEMDNGDGVWTPVVSNGQTESLVKTLTFKTKDFDPTRLSSDYIQAVYPVPNQLNFLKSEYDKGYIILNSDLQNYLFDTQDGSHLVARFTSHDAGGMDVPLLFDKSTLTISHDIPGDLVNETIYRLQYLRVPTDGGTEQELYRLHFRTSKFDTFLEKANELTYSNANSWEGSGGKTELYVFMENQTESFDRAETEVEYVAIVSSPVYYSVGLIQFEAVLTGNSWYDEHIFPLLYSEYESSGLRKLVDARMERPETLPVPPSNGVFIRKKELSSDDRFVNFRELTAAEIESNQVESIGAPAEMVYNVANLVWWDFQNFRPLSHQVTPQTDYTETLWNTGTLRNLIRGEYQVKIKYVLPGKTEATSEVEFTYIY